MRRIMLMVCRSIFFVPYYFCRLVHYGKEKNKNYDEAFDVCRAIVKKAIKTGRIKVNVIGRENLPEKSGYLITPNHQGMFDILLCVEGSNQPFCFISKKEVENVFLIKHVLAALDGYSMDRSDLRQSMRIMKNVENDLRGGRNFVIFPEGTRSRDGNNTLEFKGGTFKAAMKAKAPIIPCALVNSFQPFDEKSIRPIEVAIIFLEPIYAEEYDGMTTVEIATEVRGRIQARINEYLNL